MVVEVVKGRFGLHQGGGKQDLHHPVPFVQIYVKSSALSRAPDLAISPHLTTEAEIDAFIDDALAELNELRADAKRALAAAE